MPIKSRERDERAGKAEMGRRLVKKLRDVEK